MQTGITGEPPQYAYRLRVEDVVAYWVYLCCHAPSRMVPPAVISEMIWPLAAFPAFAATLLMLALVAVGDPRGRSWHTGAAVALLVIGFLGSVVLAQLISARPGLFLEGRSGLPFARWLCLSRLLGLARKQEGGRLDTTAVWRFSMTPEGFTLLTEREEVWAGVKTVAGKRIAGPWAVLEYVGGTESHLFLTARDGTVFIVPQAAVPRGALPDLVETARRYHRAAVEGPPPATGIVLRVEPVQGIMRQEDRVAR